MAIAVEISDQIQTLKKKNNGVDQGYSWYDGELIPNKPSRYTAEEQLYLLLGVGYAIAI